MLAKWSLIYIRNSFLVRYNVCFWIWICLHCCFWYYLWQQVVSLMRFLPKTTLRYHSRIVDIKECFCLDLREHMNPRNQKTTKTSVGKFITLYFYSHDAKIYGLLFKIFKAYIHSTIIQTIIPIFLWLFSTFLLLVVHQTQSSRATRGRGVGL